MTGLLRHCGLEPQSILWAAIISAGPRPGEAVGIRGMDPGLRRDYRGRAGMTGLLRHCGLEPQSIEPHCNFALIRVYLAAREPIPGGGHAEAHRGDRVPAR